MKGKTFNNNLEMVAILELPHKLWNRILAMTLKGRIHFPKNWLSTSLHARHVRRHYLNFNPFTEKIMIWVFNEFVHCDSWNYVVKIQPRATSGTLFKEARLASIAKSTRNRILAKMAENKCSLKSPPQTKRHRNLRLNWAIKTKQMKIHIKCVLCL